MKNKTKFLLLCVAAVLVMIVSVGVGSVFISPKEIFAAIGNRLFGIELAQDANPVLVNLIMDIRMPRVFLSFLVGMILGICGAVMQSVLNNPLASPFSLGVSAGAGLGASIVIVLGVSLGILGAFLLPITGVVFALAAVLLVMVCANSIDRNFSNNTIVLTGMVLSLFLNAIITTLSASSPQNSQRITLWQLGSFSMKEWRYVWVILPIAIIGIAIFLRYTKELDIMTFGEETAKTVGLNLKLVKWVLLCTTAVLVGVSVSFVGIIGFVDLISPHIVRKLFGSNHKWILPASAVFGGTFLTACDLLSRTLISPSEIPIGSITAFIGAPFFIYIFFMNRKKVA